jgi:hypothetical protein
MSNVGGKLSSSVPSRGCAGANLTRNRGLGFCPDLSSVVQDDEGGRGNRTEPGVSTPGWPRGRMRPESGARKNVAWCISFPTRLDRASLVPLFLLIVGSETNGLVLLLF